MKVSTQIKDEEKYGTCMNNKSEREYKNKKESLKKATCNNMHISCRWILNG